MEGTTEFGQECLSNKVRYKKLLLCIEKTGFEVVCFSELCFLNFRGRY